MSFIRHHGNALVEWMARARQNIFIKIGTQTLLDLNVTIHKIRIYKGLSGILRAYT